MFRNEVIETEKKNKRKTIYKCIYSLYYDRVTWMPTYVQLFIDVYEQNLLLYKLGGTHLVVVHLKKFLIVKINRKIRTSQILWTEKLIQNENVITSTT